MSICRETFPEFVQAELTKRQNLLEGKDSLRNELVNYQTTRNAWVKMTSGVNTYNSKKQDYDNELAKKYVLLGGTLYKTGELKNQDGKVEGDLFTKKSGIGSSFDKNAYSNTSALGQPYQRGIRPMPGITNISTTSKNAYGSLIEAVVSFTCWDIQQLEDLELLYMRPGYTVLLEWGWTYSKQPYFTYFYDILNKGLTDFQQVNKDLFNLSKDSKGNYEAILGYVKNYNWRARPDGGYDCTTTLISLGEVLESIKVNYSPFNIDVATSQDPGLLKKGTYQITPPNQISPGTPIETIYSVTAEEKGNDNTIINLQDVYSKGILYGLFYEMRSLIEKMPNQDDLDKIPDVISYPSLKIINPLGVEQSYNVFKYKFEEKNVSTETENSKSDKNPNSIFTKFRHYITLESLCELINNYVLIVGTDTEGKEAKSITKISTKDREYAGYSNNLTCLSHPLQISTDFKKCLIKADYWFNIKPTAEKDKASDYPPIGNINPILKEIIEAEKGTPIISLIFDSRKTAARKFVRAVDIVGNSKGGINNNVALESILREIRKQLENSLYSIDGNTNAATFNFSSDGTETGDTSWGNITTQEAIKSGDQFGLNFLKLLKTDATSLYDNIANTLTLSSNRPGDFNPNFINYFTDPSNRTEIIDIFQRELNFQPLSEPHSVYLLSVFNQSIIKETAEAARKVLEGFNRLNPYFTGTYGRLGSISNIYVDLGYLMDVVSNPNIESIDTQNKNTISLINFFKDVLKTIQQCIGNLNNFDLHIDKDGVGRIIDINFTDDNNFSASDKNANQNNKPFQLQIHNLKSTVRNYQLESKIFPEQGTIVAISAQTDTPGKLGYNNSTLIAYNRGVQDRLIPKKASISDNLASSPNVGNLIVRNFAHLRKYFEFLKDSENNEYAPGVYDNALRDLIGLTSQVIGSNPNQFKAIMPVMLSFDMDGIGGIVIGNIFKINDEIIPNGYKETIGRKLGFLVKSFNHKIESNDWITSIEAYPVVLEQETDTRVYWNTFFNQGYTIDFFISSSAASRPNVNAPTVFGFGEVSTTVPLEARPLLDTIAYAEGTAGVKQNGYDVIVGYGKTIDNWNPNYTGGHPSLKVPGLSSAAGRYQFVVNTWNGLKLPTFNKENQDKGAWKLINESRKYPITSVTDAYTIAQQQIANNKIDVYQNKAFLEFLDKNYQEWASLPNSKNEFTDPKQRGRFNVVSIYNVYIEAVKKYPTGFYPGVDINKALKIFG